MKSELKTRKHHFEMIIDENSQVLILGSLPSLMSEKNNFYYGNPFNRFWKIIGALFNEDNLINQSNEYKKEVILKYYPEYLYMTVKLPSTSSANARCSLEKLIDEWKVIKKLDKFS